ncbi:unnamed protein product, partial [Polarella glacialis]
AVILQTVPEFREGGPAFFWLEVVATAVFTMELILRFLGSESASAFASNGFNMVDLVAVLPGYFDLLMLLFPGSQAEDAKSLRLLRLMWMIRILRLVKVARHSKLLSASVIVLTKVWCSSILVILSALGFLTIVSASLMYYVESDECELLGVSCEGFTSIPAAFWFSISTLTTVGYGDVVPAKTMGKILAGFMSVCGVIVVALAGAMLSFDFADHFSEARWPEDEDRQGRLELQNVKSKELQEFAMEFRRAWDGLAACLKNTAAQQRAKAEVAGEASPLTMMPVLRLIEERGRVLCAEAQACANAIDVATVQD